MQGRSKNRSSSAGTRLLALTILGLATFAFRVPAQAETSHPIFSPPQCAQRGLIQGRDTTRVRLGEDIVVERIKGQAALQHLKELQKRRPEAFASARNELRAYGFVPTDKVFIERTVRLASRVPGDGSTQIVPTQDYGESSSDGEILFWSWSDGNDGTWEGAIYMSVYSAGAASTWTGQIDTSTETYPWIYYQKTWEGKGRDGPPRVDFEGPQLSAPKLSVVSATFDRDVGGAQARYLPVDFYNWAVCWRACVVGGCTSAALGCRWTDGAWPGCFGAWCVAIEVGCGITCFLAK